MRSLDFPNGVTKRPHVNLSLSLSSAQLDERAPARISSRWPDSLPGLSETHWLFYLGTLSPNPWDLSPIRQNGAFLWAARAAHRLPAAGSALRSHPCVAVSSAQVRSV